MATSSHVALGEVRWAALRTLGQAVADCLPDGDDDRRLINGLLGSSVMGPPPLESILQRAGRLNREKQAGAGAALPGFEPERE